MWEILQYVRFRDHVCSTIFETFMYELVCWVDIHPHVGAKAILISQRSMTEIQPLAWVVWAEHSCMITIISPWNIAVLHSDICRYSETLVPVVKINDPQTIISLNISQRSSSLYSEVRLRYSGYLHTTTLPDKYGGTISMSPSLVLLSRSSCSSLLIPATTYTCSQYLNKSCCISLPLAYTLYASQSSRLSTRIFHRNSSQGKV